VWKWDVWLDKVFEAIEADAFEDFRTQYYEMPLSLADRSLDIPTFGNMVSSEVQAFAAALRTQIIDGSVAVPVIDEWPAS
jgi:basic membrane lipoprotein Med (substrate-binding protein (PBP1-ABC) superfamily)